MLRLVLLASVALAAQARPNVTQASNTVVVERLRMPDNFFTMMSNFTSNHTAPNGTTSRKLKDEERRLESSYCASAFSDMAGAYIWLGDAETADSTDYDDVYSYNPPTSGGGSAEPYFNFENYPETFGSHMEMYLIHNQPFGSWYEADEFCAEVKYSLDVIDINPNRGDLDIGTTGATCHDCFAYGGAMGVVGMHCYKESETTYCDVSASISGAFEYNLDLLIKDPTITTTVSLPIWEGMSTELGRFGDSLGVLAIVLDVTPVLHAEMGGTLTATGELSATAHAKGSLEIGARVSSDELTVFTTSSLEFDPLTFESTGFEITAEESEIVVTPEFLVSLSVVGSALGYDYTLVSLTSTLQTPVSMATSATSTECTTAYACKAYTNLVEFGSPMLDYTVDLSEWSEGNTVDVYNELSEQMCFTYPDGIESASVTSSSAAAAKTMNNKSSSGGDDGGTVVVVIVIIIVALFVVAGVAASVGFYRSGETHEERLKSLAKRKLEVKEWMKPTKSGGGSAAGGDETSQEAGWFSSAGGVELSVPEGPSTTDQTLSASMSEGLQQLFDMTPAGQTDVAPQQQPESKPESPSIFCAVFCDTETEKPEA